MRDLDKIEIICDSITKAKKIEWSDRCAYCPLSYEVRPGVPICMFDESGWSISTAWIHSNLSVVLDDMMWG